MADPAAPPQPSPGPPPVASGAALGAAPSDPGNVNAPNSINPALPQSGNIQVDPSTGLPVATIVVNGKLITLTLNSGIKATQPVATGTRVDDIESFQTALNSIQTWYGNNTTRQKYIDEMYAAGLLSSKKSPSAAEVAFAWQLVTQEAALQYATETSPTEMRSPDSVLAAAAKAGWNNLIGAKQAPGDVGVNGTGNLNNSTDTTSQSETVYKSYVDPATAMGTLADSYFRLMGRNPTSGEYNAFMTTLYNYQNEVNTGSDKTTTKGPNTGGNVDPTTGMPVDQSGTTTGGTNTQTNTVSQRGIGTRGVQFMAGQQALASPEEGAYQAATTYFNAFIKSLQGPAAGMEASGPTVTIP
jgi:hypothetical protein